MNGGRFSIGPVGHGTAYPFQEDHMPHARCLSWLLTGLCVILPLICQAAGNPTVDALSQGTVIQFSGKEAVSEPFAFDVTLATGDKALNFAQIVGQPLTIVVAPGRVASGMVESIEQVDHAAAQGQYRIRLAPALNRLKHRSASRTFYNVAAPQIVTAVLNEAGVQNVELRIAASLPPKEMTVQYQETDFMFVSRLLEEAGIHISLRAFSDRRQAGTERRECGISRSACGKTGICDGSQSGCRLLHAWPIPA
jgi:hypothetical protein